MITVMHVYVLVICLYCILCVYIYIFIYIIYIYIYITRSDAFFIDVHCIPIQECNQPLAITGAPDWFIVPFTDKCQKRGLGWQGQHHLKVCDHGDGIPKKFPFEFSMMIYYITNVAFSNVGSCLNQMLHTTPGLVWRIQVEVKSVNTWTRPDFSLRNGESILRAIVCTGRDLSHRSQHMEPGETITARPPFQHVLEIWKALLGWAVE